MTELADRLGPDKVKLGECCTLWWNDDFPTIDADISFGQAVSEMALAGFQGCSIGHKYPSDPAVLKAALDLRGLRVSEPWTSTYFTISKMEQKTVDAFEETLAHIKALGGTELVVAEFGASSHLLPIDVFANRPVFTDAQWDALTSGLEPICHRPHRLRRRRPAGHGPRLRRPHRPRSSEEHPAGGRPQGSGRRPVVPGGR